MRIVHDRDRRRPGFRVLMSYGLPDDSENPLLLVARVVKLACFSVIATLVLGGFLVFAIWRGYQLGGWPWAVLLPTLSFVPVFALFSGVLALIGRYRFDAIGHRAEKVTIHSSTDEIAQTLSFVILAFEEIGFDGHLAAINWKRSNHSRVYYQAMVDSLERATEGRSPLLAGQQYGAVAKGLQITDITRNIQELKSMETSMFKVIYRYHLIVWHLMLYPSIALLGASILVFLWWVSSLQ